MPLTDPAIVAPVGDDGDDGDAHAAAIATAAMTPSSRIDFDIRPPSQIM